MTAEAITAVASAAASVISVMIGAAGFYLIWKKRREDELRKDDVLAWANESISALQSVAVICEIGNSIFTEAELKSRLAELAIKISTLIERGRMFFRNRIVDNHGAEKESAYRGYRPMILDPLVIAFQIALDWPGAEADKRKVMRRLSGTCAKKLVSLAQPEVGRERTASAGAKTPGDGFSLRTLLDDPQWRREWTEPAESK
jgi:hypothetical protein